jgi:hypothetical protein
LTDALLPPPPAPANAVMGSASKNQITRLYEDVAQASPATLR